ncbi:hypothetical protein [Mesorhizobium retamae]|nr:hypothetical protein [Mesorhizobium sp. IRAMC:0171]
MRSGFFFASGRLAVEKIIEGGAVFACLCAGLLGAGPLQNNG